VTTRSPTRELLVRASELCSRALAQLPETPVSAAGVNVRYRIPEYPDAVFDFLRVPLDGVLADAGFEIAASTTKKTVRLPPGVINLQITVQDGGGTVELNFHRESTSSQELQEWLARTNDFFDQSTNVIRVLGLENVRREIHA
jgi:hypothetical protein